MGEWKIGPFKCQNIGRTTNDFSILQCSIKTTVQTTYNMG